MEKLRPGEDMNAAIEVLSEHREESQAEIVRSSGLPHEILAEAGERLASLDRAIAVLRDWPRWGKLVEAAGKVNKKLLMPAFESLPRPGASELNIVYNQLRDLLAAIPEK